MSHTPSPDLDKDWKVAQLGVGQTGKKPTVKRTKACLEIIS
jgi:hypothetical protein